ncbi:MAG TPA: AAA family ATPase [Anaeromyxobacteraceae bacterium]|nr:AAA family ATPase [Anaeromyxobacteraceae bacterium]
MAGPSFEALKRFFETSPAARAATGPLHRNARVGLELSGGPAQFTMQAGGAQVVDGPAEDPDFTLVLPDGAVSHITAVEGDDVGAFGVEFFKLVLSREPETKVRIRVHSSTARLLSNGYLGVLALGGAKVGWWLLRNGVKNPKAAIDRLRGK